MRSATKLTVCLDDSIKDNTIFTSVTVLYLRKPDIFKYGVLNLDVPPLKIKENDFEYLQSKIPFLYGLYEDFIHLDQTKIYNYATNETARVISEIIGVGVGLHYAITLLTIVPNKIKKIQHSAQKGKYLDFSFNQGNRNYEYEYEAKGTTYENHIKFHLDDIKEKKKYKDNTACRFGSVILLENMERLKNHSLLYVMMMNILDPMKTLIFIIILTITNLF